MIFKLALECEWYYTSIIYCSISFAALACPSFCVMVEVWIIKIFIHHALDIEMSVIPLAICIANKNL